MPSTTLASSRARPAVAAPDGSVTGRAHLLARNGRARPGHFTVATSWPADAAFQATYTRRAGRPPTRAGQVMIDRASAQAGHFGVGDSITIMLAGQARVFTITGMTGYGSADSFAGGSLAIFSLPAP